MSQHHDTTPESNANARMTRENERDMLLQKLKDASKEIDDIFMGSPRSFEDKLRRHDQMIHLLVWGIGRMLQPDFIHDRLEGEADAMRDAREGR